MTPDRRSFLRMTCAAVGAVAAPLPLRAATGPRVFHLYRGDSRIGAQTLDVKRSGGQVEVSVSIDIAVRILGLPAYRYRLDSREAWERGRLLRLEGQTNDNGTEARVSVTRDRDTLLIEGTGFTGRVAGDPATTTYWTQAFLGRPVWISTQDGKPLNVEATRAGAVRVPTPTGPTEAERWAVRGDIGMLDLFYDRNGEWVGNEFEARGEKARFVLAERGRDLAGLF